MDGGCEWGLDGVHKKFIMPEVIGSLAMHSADHLQLLGVQHFPGGRINPGGNLGASLKLVITKAFSKDFIALD